jgi:hypothetical protein
MALPLCLVVSQLQGHKSHEQSGSSLDPKAGYNKRNKAKANIVEVGGMFDVLGSLLL